MKATTLIAFAALALPALAGVPHEQSCSVGFGCECNYKGTSDRCAVWTDKYYGVFSNCDCPTTYHGYDLESIDCINVGKYNGRHKCRYVESINNICYDSQTYINIQGWLNVSFT